MIIINCSWIRGKNYNGRRWKRRVRKMIIINVGYRRGNYSEGRQRRRFEEDY